jgi:ABC-type uncharacterized transport system fused permease/ATPase subunit
MMYWSYIFLCETDRSDAPRLLDAHLRNILENVRLVYLLEREGWDSTPNWEDVLSLGEQQRLGMVSNNRASSFLFVFKSLL